MYNRLTIVGFGRVSLGQGNIRLLLMLRVGLGVGLAIK